MKMDKVLFVKKFEANPKFMTNDLNILREKYSVSPYNMKTPDNFLIVIPLFKMFFYLLFNAWRFKLIYIWFADYHSFLPVLFAKLFAIKRIICAGGYECTNIPEINCGVFSNESFSKRIRAFCVKFSLKNCSLIIPVDESLIRNTNTYLYSDIENRKPLEDGIINFIPEIKTNFETIYPGFDSKVFRKNTETEKESSVVSAGLIINEDEFRRKGFDLLIEAAKQMQDVKFVLIGFSAEFRNKKLPLVPENVQLLEITGYDGLVKEYSKAKVFAQISMFEGMPSTICEAMMCECIPVGSNVNGIPKIVNGCGELVQKKTVNDVITSLKKALNYPAEIGVNSRNHIINNFSLEHRRQKLLNSVEKLLKTS